MNTLFPLKTGEAMVAPGHNRFHPLSWSRNEKLVAVLALAVGGWAFFRPDLLLKNSDSRSTSAPLRFNRAHPQLNRRPDKAC